MPHLAAPFTSLPPEYQTVIRLAQEQHGISITPLQELVVGWSKAAVYLVKEFYDTLGVRLSSSQYSSQPLAILIENQPERTENIHASGYPTARIYLVFEVRIRNDALIQAMIENGTRCSDLDLGQLALRNASEGGPGRANTILALPLERLTKQYLGMPPEKRSKPVKIGGHLLDGNVAAVLPDVQVPKYQRFQARSK